MPRATSRSGSGRHRSPSEAEEFVRRPKRTTTATAAGTRPKLPRRMAEPSRGSDSYSRRPLRTPPSTQRLLRPPLHPPLTASPDSASELDVFQEMAVRRREMSPPSPVLHPPSPLLPRLTRFTAQPSLNLFPSPRAARPPNVSFTRHRGEFQSPILRAVPRLPVSPPSPLPGLGIDWQPRRRNGSQSAQPSSSPDSYMSASPVLSPRRLRAAVTTTPEAEHPPLLRRPARRLSRSQRSLDPELQTAVALEEAAEVGDSTLAAITQMEEDEALARRMAEEWAAEEAESATPTPRRTAAVAARRRSRSSHLAMDDSLRDFIVGDEEVSDGDYEPGHLVVAALVRPRVRQRREPLGMLNREALFRGRPRLDGEVGYEALLQLTEAMGEAGGLAKSAINSLPLLTFHKGDGAEAEDEEETCPVCMSGLAEGDQLRLLPCAHRFHRACADRWLKQANSCPICRERAVAPPVAAAPAPTAGVGRTRRVARVSAFNPHLS